MRAASVRSLGHKNEIDMFIHEKVKQEKLQQEMQKKMKYGGLPKSTSVGMARIDEDEEGEEGFRNRRRLRKSLSFCILVANHMLLLVALSFSFLFLSLSF